jgi:hypothetical protein
MGIWGKNHENNNEIIGCLGGMENGNFVEGMQSMNRSTQPADPVCI